MRKRVYQIIDGFPELAKEGATVNTAARDAWWDEMKDDQNNKNFAAFLTKFAKLGDDTKLEQSVRSHMINHKCFHAVVNQERGSAGSASSAGRAAAEDNEAMPKTKYTAWQCTKLKEEISRGYFTLAQEGDTATQAQTPAQILPP